MNFFTKDYLDPKALYGLPKRILFCKSCVISNQRPSSEVEFKHTENSKKSTIRFDEDGICDACRFNDVKQEQIDWARREQSLIELLNKHRRNDGSYDIIIPGSGGKDSAYTAHILKYKYGMNPLTALILWIPMVIF